MQWEIEEIQEAFTRSYQSPYLTKNIILFKTQ